MAKTKSGLQVVSRSQTLSAKVRESLVNCPYKTCSSHPPKKRGVLSECWPQCFHSDIAQQDTHSKHALVFLLRLPMLARLHQVQVATTLVFIQYLTHIL